MVVILDVTDNYPLTFGTRSCCGGVAIATSAPYTCMYSSSLTRS